MAQCDDETWVEVYNNQLTEDQDPENGLSQDQAGRALMEIGQNPTLMQLGELWQLKEKDSGISLQELKDFNTRLGDPKENLRDALEKVFDTDGNGQISKTEFIALLQATDAYGSGIADITQEGAMEMIDHLFGNEPEISYEDCVEKIQQNNLDKAYEPDA